MIILLIKCYIFFISSLDESKDEMKKCEEKVNEEIKNFDKNAREFERIYGSAYIPISAPLLFLKVYDENNERKEALEAGLEILKKCDIFAYKTDDYIKSKGLRGEYRIAKEIGVEIILF